MTGASHYLPGAAGPTGRRAALADAAPRLRCPYCHEALTLAGTALKCPRGHTHDIARHGHVTLMPPRRRPPAGDDAAMVAARAAFLGAGHYEPITAAVAEAAAAVPAAAGCAVELGAGTGHHLAGALAKLPGWTGIALDTSRPALRHATRADPRIAAIVCDVWDPLPLADGAADLVLVVFSPRNGPEIARVLAPDGALVVVTPAEGHLEPLRTRLGMLQADPRKSERLRARLPEELRCVESRKVRFELRLSRDDARALVGMGPSAHHLDSAALDAALAGEEEPLTATAAVTVQTFRRA